MCSTRLFFSFPGFGKAGLFLPQDRDEYKYTRAVIAGHGERKRRGNRGVFVFVIDAGGAAAGQTRPSRVHRQAVRLPGNPSGAASGEQSGGRRHTQSFLARGPSRLTHEGLVCGFNVCFINCLPERGDQGSKKTNGAPFHANFKLISRKIEAVSPF